jgi:hypothetical protein
MTKIKFLDQSQGLPKDKPILVSKPLANVYNSSTETFDTGKFEPLFVSSDAKEYDWTIDVDPNYIIRLQVLEIVDPENVEVSVIDQQKGLNYEPFVNAEIISNFKNLRVTYLFASFKIRVKVRLLKISGITRSAFKFIYTTVPKVIDVSQPDPDTQKYDLKIRDIHMERSLIKDKIVWLVKAPRGYHVIAKIKQTDALESRPGQLTFSLLGK